MSIEQTQHQYLYQRIQDLEGRVARLEDDQQPKLTLSILRDILSDKLQDMDEDYVADESNEPAERLK